MKPLPNSLLTLLEPAIYAVRQGTPSEVKLVLDELDFARRELSITHEALHYPSYSAGAMSSLREVLNASLHRAGLNSVIDGVRAAQRGLDVLRAAGRAVVLGKKLSQKALATQIGMNEGNFSRLAKRLVELGALEVHRQGASSYLQPTVVGEAALDEMLAGWRAATYADDEGHLKLQLNEPFRPASDEVRSEAFGAGLSHVRNQAGVAMDDTRRRPQFFEQTDTAATA